jgi:hypothetical protein
MEKKKIKNDLPIEWTGKAKEIGMIESELMHIVYDCSIPTLEERKNKAQIFYTAREVSEHLGVKIDTVFRNRIASKRIKALNGKMYAVRVAKNNLNQ